MPNFQNMGFPFNIFALADLASANLAVGTQFRLTNSARHKIIQMIKVGHGMVFDNVCLQNLAIPFKIFAMAKASLDVRIKRY